MTSTDRPVRRVTRAPYRVLYAEARPVVVQIGPGDVLEFREWGRRQVWRLPIAEAFRLALRRAAGTT